MVKLCVFQMVLPFRVGWGAGCFGGFCFCHVVSWDGGGGKRVWVLLGGVSGWGVGDLVLPGGIVA